MWQKTKVPIKGRKPIVWMSFWYRGLEKKWRVLSKELDGVEYNVPFVCAGADRSGARRRRQVWPARLYLSDTRIIRTRFVTCVLRRAPNMAAGTARTQACATSAYNAASNTPPPSGSALAFPFLNSDSLIRHTMNPPATVYRPLIRLVSNKLMTYPCDRVC